MTIPKIALIFSLILLGGLMIAVFVPRLATGRNYSVVARDHIIQQSDGYLIQFDILNDEGQDTTYTITIVDGDYKYSEDVTISDGRMFTFGHHLYAGDSRAGVVNLVVRKVGQATALADINYYLK
jgi:hypothetical protein